MKDLLNIAIDLTNRRFADKQDRSGQPLILHPMRVMMSSSTIEGRIVGIMHDIIEDTEKDLEPVTVETLRQLGFPENIVAAVETLTHRSDETYAAYIERIVQGPKLAVRVKLNDLNDNLNRIHELPEGEGMRQRYLKARDRLLKVWEYYG